MLFQVPVWCLLFTHKHSTPCQSHSFLHFCFSSCWFVSALIARWVIRQRYHHVIGSQISAVASTLAFWPAGHGFVYSSRQIWRISVGSEGSPSLKWVPGKVLRGKGGWHYIDHMTHCVPIDLYKYGLAPYTQYISRHGKWVLIARSDAAIGVMKQ